MPRVSVLITTYNRPKLLETAIESVLKQTYRDFEIIVLDDNSDDEEQKQVLLKYWNNPKVIILKSNISKEERKLTTRYCTMINEGLKIAKGEFISYLCDDDYFAPEKIAKMVNYLDQHQDHHIVYGAQRTIYLNEQGDQRDESYRQANQVYDSAACNVDHSSVIHRRTLYEQLGGWPDGPENWTSGDAAYWRVLNGAGYLFYPIDEILDIRVEHGGNYTRGTNLKDKIFMEEEKHE